MAHVQHRSYPGSSAFTIVEFLVVVAVIALLMLFSLPLMGVLRERAAATRCVSNLRSVGMVVLSYATDNYNMIMPTVATDEPASNDRNWPWKLVRRGYLPQVKDVTSALTSPVFYCPLAAVASYDKTTSWAQVYGLRQWRKPGGSRHDVYKPASIVERPQDFVLLADSFRPSSGLPWYALGTGSNSSNARIHLRHSGRANCFMLDGRVASLDAVELERLRAVTAEYGWSPEYQWGK